MPLNDAEVGQPADERVCRGLEDLDQQRTVWVELCDLDVLARAVERLDGLSSSGEGR